MPRPTTGGCPWTAAFVCLGLCGCAPSRPPELRGAVLILLDTVRADHVSCYGYPRTTTPNLDRLARDGVRFEHTVSDAPWTLPAVKSLMTATYSQRFEGWKLPWSLVDAFAEAGFVTAAFTEGGFVSRAFELDRGFAHYEEEEGAVRLWKGNRPVGSDAREDAQGGAARTFARAAAWLRENDDQPFFLFIHTYEAHAPYTAHAFTAGMRRGAVGDQLSIELLEELQASDMTLDDDELAYVTALYDGDILTADLHVGELLAVIDELGLADETLVVVTSDHGEELGGHFPAFVADHGHALLDTLLSVPLIVHDPTRDFDVREVAAQVRLVDVLPTMAELLRVTVDRPTDGASLVPLMTGAEREGRLAVAAGTKVGPQRIGVRTGAFKYIESVGPAQGEVTLRPAPAERQLYDLSADPAERDNLAGERPALVEELHALVQEYRARFKAGDPPALEEQVNSELLERLESLGYVR